MVLSLCFSSFVETDCIFSVFDSIKSKVLKAEKAKYQPIPFANLINVSLVFDSQAGMVHTNTCLEYLTCIHCYLVSQANIESLNCVLTVTPDPRQIH